MNQTANVVRIYEAESTKSVTISEKDYDKLIEDSYFLQSLRNMGVDSWEGYDSAIEDFING